MRLSAAILAGGQGTRLWPKSRVGRPKQFVSFDRSGRTLFGHALERIASLVRPEDRWVIAEASSLALVREEAPNLDSAQLIGEPVGRNTAAAVVLSSLLVKKKYPQEPAGQLLVVPSDHFIHPVSEFAESVQALSRRLLNQPGVGVFGVRPTRPETGYGYIHAKPEANSRVAAVLSFEEKPQPLRAEELLAVPNVYWNSGIFLLSIEPFLEAAVRLIPEIVTPLSEWVENRGRTAFPPLELYERLPAHSVDKAVIERLNETQTPLWVIPFTMLWDDLGSFRALRRIGNLDSGGNVAVGTVILSECANTIVDGGSQRVVVHGVKDLVVVATEDTVLVLPEAELNRIPELRTRALTEWSKEPSRD